MGNLLINNRDFELLERIEQQPDATQASLADQLGVAVGTINWHLKRLVDKGYVKVQRVERRKLRYIITPEGIALRARLALDYIQTSFQLYRLVRERMNKALQEVHQAGFDQIQLLGEDADLLDICRLTCLEHSVEIVDHDCVPLVRINGLKIFVVWEDVHQSSDADHKNKLESGSDLKE